MGRSPGWFSILILAGFCTGCTLTSFMSPAALDHGEFQKSASVAMAAVNESEFYAIPTLDLMGRVGLGKGFEGGVRLVGFWGLMMDMKYEVAQEPTTVSIDAGGALGRTGAADVFGLIVFGDERLHAAIRVGRYFSTKDDVDFSSELVAMGFIAGTGFGRENGPMLETGVHHWAGTIIWTLGVAVRWQ